MSSETEKPSSGFVKLELRTAYGPIYRDVSTKPPREARRDEIPVIDVSPICGDLEARKRLASQIKSSAEGVGFFYIKNHGISEEIIQNALQAAKSFFVQDIEKKMLVSKDLGKWYNGFARNKSALTSRTEGLDNREAFSWRYEPQYDPEYKDPETTPADVAAYIRGEQYVWDGTEHIPDFKGNCLKYWQECLKLARRLVRIFALCLDLPEDYFDSVTTYPGADGAFNYYPGLSPEQIASAKNDDIGLGSHTDLQCFTLLWQDHNGGLQVLNNQGEWIKASPIPETFVVNIADYLQRLSNDRFQSTVHRVFNRSVEARYSMPFFFGFNFNEKCGVLPSCTSPDNPAKYEPISCGDWCQLRFEQGDVDKKASAY